MSVMKRHPRLLGIAVVVALIAGFYFFNTNDSGDDATAGDPAVLPVMTVYQSPTCGCCGKWIEHMEAAGFTVKTIEQADVSPVKSQYGLPRDLGSCHTAIVDGYVVEGHVPADLVKKMLREKAPMAGIAVPGMPIGSPGMEQGGRKDPYKVVAFYRGGGRQIYATR